MFEKLFKVLRKRKVPDFSDMMIGIFEDRKM